MTWQDDLQRLDQELAAGRLSADDYQRRRADLLAQANADRGRATSQDNSFDQPGEPRSSPFPPAFRWDTPAAGETTHIIRPVGEGDVGSFEETQILRTPEQPPAPLGSAGPPGQDDSDRTQVVQATPPPPPLSRPSYPHDSESSPPADSHPGWTQQESTPPWASADLPPIQEPSAGWMMQGPEFFETEKKDPGNMRIVAVVATVAVLAGIAFGSWFFWGRDTSNSADPEQQEPGVTTTAPKPEDPLAPADVGGNVEPKEVSSFNDLAAVGFLTPAELDALTKAGARESRLLITNFPEGKATILVSRSPSAGQAVTARDALVDLQHSYGFVPRASPPSVRSVELIGKSDVPVTLRAIYMSGDRIVRIEMRADRSDATANNRTETIAKFEEILNTQLMKLPAND